MDHEKRQLMTVAIYYDETQVLLGMKKRGFGEGRWNGFGGKVKPYETIERAARREVFEEAGIVVGGLERIGAIDFIFQDKPKEILEVHFLRILTYYGEPKETEEMRPRWFDRSSIPYEDMWPDDRYWLPLFLEGQRFRGSILFENQNSILKNNIQTVNSLT